MSFMFLATKPSSLKINIDILNINEHIRSFYNHFVNAYVMVLLRCPGRVSSSYSTAGTYRVALVKDPIINKSWMHQELYGCIIHELTLTDFPWPASERRPASIIYLIITVEFCKLCLDEAREVIRAHSTYYCCFIDWLIDWLIFGV